MHKTVLSAVWGKREGYVFLSTLDRRTKQWQDHAFRLPDERGEINKLIAQSDDKEIYFAPAVFNDARRISKNVAPVQCLWADLDEIPPSKCFIRPSIAWRSSPGRYQAIWLLSDQISAYDAEELNKRLTYAVGADKSGWDLTQVLRIPGTRNHKYAEKPLVKLLWAKGTRYSPQDLADELPEVKKGSLEVDELDIEQHELRELVWPYRKVLGEKLYELLFTPDSAVKEGERSDRLWEMECRLLESGVPVTDVMKIAKACPWNKYRGRADESKRILSEVLKAEKEIHSSHIVSPDLSLPWTDYSNFMGRHIVGPGWLIEQIWANNSHGMIAGEPKTYKSVISTEMAVSIASSIPMWDQYKVLHDGPVLIVQEENAPWIVQDRLIKVASAKGLLKGKVYKINKPNVIHIEWPQVLPIRLLNNAGFDITTVEHRDALEEQIERLHPVMVILDPLYLMLGKLDMNDAGELREVLQWLLQLKIRYSTSIAVLHHWNKAGASPRGGQRMLGSTTLHAWVESAMYTSIRDVEKHEITIEREFRAFQADNVVMTCKMSDPGEQPLYKVDVRKITETQYSSKHSALFDALLANGSMTITEMMDIGTGYSRSGIKKILRPLERKGWIDIQKGSQGAGNATMYSVTQLGREALAKKVEREADEVIEEE